MFGKDSFHYPNGIAYILFGACHDVLREPAERYFPLTIGELALTFQTKTIEDPRDIMLWISGSLVSHKGKLRADIMRAFQTVLEHNKFEVVASQLSRGSYWFHIRKP